MSMDLVMKMLPGMMGDDLYFTTDALSITPTLGAELLANGGFSAWTGDNPDGWVVSGESGADPEVTERDPSQTHADTKTIGGAANFYSSANALQPRAYQNILTIGDFFVQEFSVNILHGGMSSDDGDVLIPETTTGTKRHTLHAGTTNCFIRSATVAPIDATVADLSCKKISDMEQLFHHTQPYGDFSVALYITGNYQGGVVFNWQDASNFARLQLDRYRGQVRLINRVAVTYIPRDQQGTGTVAQSVSPIEVPGRSFADTQAAWPRVNKGTQGYKSNQTSPAAGSPKAGDKTIRLPYTDANGISIGAMDLIAPVAGVDFTVNDRADGTGFNYTYSKRVTVSLAPTGSGVEVSFKNTATGPLYVLNFKIRGTQIYQFSPETETVIDPVSIAAYGSRPRQIDLALGSGAVFSEAIAYWLLAQYSTPRYRGKTLAYVGPESAGGVNLLALEIGDMIQLTEDQTGIAAERYVIRSIATELAQGGQIANVAFGLKRLEPSPAILDDPVYGVLDAANCLGL